MKSSLTEDNCLLGYCGILPLGLPCSHQKRQARHRNSARVQPHPRRVPCYVYCLVIPVQVGWVPISCATVEAVVDLRGID